MWHFKLFVGVCLVAPCILALNCLEPENAIDVSDPVLEAFQQVSIEDSGVKSNWSPVWNDDHGSNEFVSQEDNRVKDKCEAPNGLGLKNLLQQIDKVLPKEEIKNILKSFSADPEIKALRAFATSSETKNKLKAIEHSQEFLFLKDYSCRVLHLNLGAYHNIVSKLINPSSKRADNSERKGIKGLTNALESVLPKQQLRELYDKLMKTDDELVKAVAHMQSDEFHQLLLNVKNLPEYRELRKQVENLGVATDDVHNLLSKLLGWTSNVDVLF